jgi:hypothetical protein
MYSSETIAKTLASMDDSELVRRWRDGLFSDQAKSIAEDELARRGIDPEKQSSTVTADAGNLLPHPRTAKPYFLPLLFAAIGGATAGREIGAALAGSIGAGLAAAVVALAGWYTGSYLALLSKRRKHIAWRVLFPLLGSVAWVYLCAVAVIAARLM